MTLQEANNYLENLKSKTTKKSEIRIYEKFIYILTALKNRSFTKDEIQSIEIELDSLNLKSNPDNRKKFFKKALSNFESFLKSAHSLTSNNYYTNMSVSLGILSGVVLGVLLGESFEKSLGLSFGICIGMFIGAFIGKRLDAQAKTSGNML